MKIKRKEKRGISLMVLVITIIIMIILAAVVILSLNSSNLVSKANEAKGKSDIANAQDLATTAYAEWMLDDGDTTLQNAVNTKLTEAGYDSKIRSDAEGKVCIIPKGFKASIYEGENTVTGGLVIYETNAELVPDAENSTTNRDASREEYNQYVWIPVEGKIERYDWSQQKESLNWWTRLFNKTFTEAFKETMPFEISNSIEENGGFYIGRYEAGKPTGTALTGGTTTALDIDGTDRPVSKKGASLWNNIPWDANYANDRNMWKSRK